MPTHKLTRHGKGDRLWGECSCGLWCWLGTYHLARKGHTRAQTLKREYDAHVAYEAPEAVAAREHFFNHGPTAHEGI